MKISIFDQNLDFAYEIKNFINIWIFDEKLGFFEESFNF